MASVIFATGGSAASLADQDYVGRFEQPIPVTTTEIPTNKWGWWWDTVNSVLLQVRNRGGNLYAVEANEL